MSHHKTRRPSVTPLEDRIDPATLKVISPVDDQRQLQPGTFRATLGVQNERQTVTLPQAQVGSMLQVASLAGREGFVAGKTDSTLDSKKPVPGSFAGDTMSINPQVIDSRPGASRSTLSVAGSTTRLTGDQDQLKMRNPGTMSIAEAGKSNGNPTLSAANATYDLTSIASANNVAWATTTRLGESSSMMVAAINDESSISSLDSLDAISKPQSNDHHETDDVHRTILSTDPQPDEPVNIIGFPHSSDDDRDAELAVGSTEFKWSDANSVLALPRSSFMTDGTYHMKDDRLEDDAISTSTSVAPTPVEMRTGSVALFVLTSNAAQRSSPTDESIKSYSSETHLLPEAMRNLPESNAIPGTDEPAQPQPASIAANGAPIATHTLLSDAPATDAGQSDLLTNQNAQRRGSPPDVHRMDFLE